MKISQFCTQQAEDYYKKIVSGGIKQSEINKQEAVSIVCQTSTIKKLIDNRQDSFPTCDIALISSHIKRHTCVVYQVKTKVNGTYKPNGSAFLIAPNLIMTNNHVIPNQEIAKKSKLFYKELVGNSEINKTIFPFYPVSLLPDEKKGGYFFSGTLLDFTIVAIELNEYVQEIMSNAFSLSKVGKLKVDKLTAIIHYPEGVDGDSGEADLVRDSIGTIQSIDNCYAHHDLKTQMGSSGSPIFNLKGKLIGLHCQGKAVCPCSVNNRCCNACISMKSILKEIEKKGQTQKIKDFSLTVAQIPKKNTKVSYFNIPLLAKSFIERPQKLEEIRRAFQQFSIVTISGLGGVGKSTLSIKYGRSLEGYEFVYLIKVMDQNSIRDGLLELAERLSITEGLPGERLAILRGRLSKIEKPYLFIIDGLDDTKPFLEAKDSYFSNKNCKALITRRIQFDGSSISVNIHDISLSVFSEEEATRYITEAIPEEKTLDSVKNLANTLGFLPLALVHAVAYIEHKKILIGEYLQDFKEKGIELLSGPPFDFFQEKIITITWAISIDTIVKLDKGGIVKDLMEFIAFLAQDNIPLNLLEAWIQNTFPQKKCFLKNTLELLKKYSFIEEESIEKENNTQGKWVIYKIHPLVQQVIIYNLHDDEKIKIRAILYKTLCDELRFFKSQPEEDFSIPKSRFLKTYINHIIVYINHMETLRSMPRFKESIDWRNLWCDLAWLYLSTGDFEKSCESCMKITEKLKQDQISLEAYYYLAKGRKLLGELDLALKSSNKIFDLGGKLKEYDKSFIVKNYKVIMGIYRDLGDYENAIQWAKKTLDFIGKLGVNNSYDRESIYHQIMRILGDALSNYKKYLDGKILKKLKFTIGEYIEGYGGINRISHQSEYAKKAEIALHHSTVGQLCKKLDDPEQALRHFQLELEINIEIYGKNSSRVAKSYNDIAYLQCILGFTEDALESSEKAIDINEKFFEKKSRYTADCYTTKAEILMKGNNFEKALPIAEEAFEINRKLFKKETRYTAAAYFRIARILDKIEGKNKDEELRNKNKALEYVEEAYLINKKIFVHGSIYIEKCLNLKNIIQGKLDVLENWKTIRTKIPNWRLSPALGHNILDILEKLSVKK
ncbi:tetratricopeptide repeat protein [Rhabdochlamydiaceae symbiont of Dictyostelium giganteum]|uniref:tetratricopeptide repeat protein n=1 Tax=Rhabdochlamydiaceae symbiont of Dictyostelium giganteum TaxID=3342349 RepID=UPI00384F2BAE